VGLCVYTCVCVRERDRERKGGRERQRELAHRDNTVQQPVRECVRERVCECVRGEEREKERVRVCVYVCVCVCKLIMTPQPCSFVEILKSQFDSHFLSQKSALQWFFRVDLVES